MKQEKKLVEIEIRDLAFDGKSVGHMDGKVVFCDAGLPGETVRAHIIKRKRRFNTAKVQEIVNASDQRIEPKCQHFDYCGGCTWQDLTYEDQLHYKRNQVVGCMERIAKLPDVEVTDCVGSENVFFYRNKMEFSFNTDSEKGFTLGLHRKGRWDEVFDVKKCWLESDTSNDIIHWMRDFVRKYDIPVYDVNEHTGFMRFLMIREAKHTNQILVNVVTNYGDMPHQQELVSGLTGQFDNIVTITHNQNGQKSNVATGEIETVLYGPGYIEEEILGKRFRILANSFFQTNPVQAERLYQIGFDMLQPQPDDRVLDLYCGTGAIGLCLAEKVKTVIGVEIVADAIKIARENAKLNDLTNVRFFEGNVREILKDELAGAKFDVVILDPPRAGMHPKALKRAIELMPRQFLYISCNPSTFARDAAEIVASGYNLPKVTPVDMFPHTKHIEVVGVFNRQ